MRDDNLLFYEGDLYRIIENQKQQLIREIDGLDTNYILNTSPDDLSEYFEKKYRLTAPVLKVDQIYVDQGETNIDVSRDHSRIIFDRSRPIYIKGTLVEFIIPFEGEADLFKFKPSTFNFNPPRAIVERQEVHLKYARADHGADELRKEFDHDLQNIQDFLGWVAGDVAPFNSAVKQTARQHIEKRREKLLKDQGMAAALGFPMRKRNDAPQTYTAPVNRSKLPIQRPQATTAPYKPEPTLDTQEYEHILNVMSNMVLVMERSPKAFSKMGEENLRDHFLVQLNAQYEGQATGETFNYDGKTDILIRVEGRNVFIAECKFWKGPEGLSKTIDQLLGYTSWRDTKTAIVLFNRNKGFSEVLLKIPEVVKAHPNFKRQLEYRSETGFRFVLHQPNDKNREVLLTILAFDLPE